MEGKGAGMIEVHCTLRTLLDCAPMEVTAPVLWTLALAILLVIVVATLWG